MLLFLFISFFFLNYHQGINEIDKKEAEKNDGESVP